MNFMPVLYCTYSVALRTRVWLHSPDLCDMPLVGLLRHSWRAKRAQFNTDDKAMYFDSTYIKNYVHAHLNFTMTVAFAHLQSQGRN